MISSQEVAQGLFPKGIVKMLTPENEEANIVIKKERKEPIKPLETNNLDKDTYEITRLILQFESENSGFLENDNPIVQELQSYLDRMKDPNAPPTRLLISVNNLESNAYSLPDGSIVVTQALINEMDYIEEVIAVLAHEQVHFEKNHHKKQPKDWFEGETISEVFQTFTRGLGVKRLHEYQADFSLIAKLDSLGVDTLSFESAIRKIGGSFRKNFGGSKDDPVGFSILHGSQLERALNIYQTHFVVDFASSVMTQETRRPIPKEWKREVRECLIDQLDKLRPGEKWRELVTTAGPTVLSQYLDYILTDIKVGTLERKDLFEGRRNAQKLATIIEIIRERIASSNLSEDEKRRSLVLCLTEGTDRSLWDLEDIFQSRIWLSLPKERFKKIPDLQNLLHVCDFTPEGIASYIELHKKREAYKIAGLEREMEEMPKKCLGKEGVISYFLKRTKLRFEEDGQLKSGESDVKDFVTSLRLITEKLSEFLGEEEANRWFNIQIKKLVGCFIKSNRNPFGRDREQLIKKTSELLSFLNREYKVSFRIEDLENFAKQICRGLFKQSEAIRKKALNTFMEKLRPVDEVLLNGVNVKNEELIASLLAKSPQEFQQKLSNLVAKEKLPLSSITWLIDVITSNRQRFENLPTLDLHDLTKEGMKRLGLEVNLDEVSETTLREYQKLKYTLEVIFILTADLPLSKRILLLQDYFDKSEIREILNNLPIFLLDDLSRFIIDETSERYKVEAKFNLSPPLLLEEQERLSLKETYQKIERNKDLIVSLPLFEVLRDKILSQKEDKTILDVVNIYSYYMNLMNSVYHSKEKSFWGVTLTMTERIAPITKELLKFFTNFDITTKTPEETVVYYRLLKEFLPLDLESAKILSTLLERNIRVLDFESALKFLEEEAVQGRISLDLINKFIEERVYTLEDYRKCKDTIARVIDRIMTLPPTEAGAFVIADYLLEQSSRDMDMARFLETLIQQKTDDSELRSEIAYLYWRVFVEERPYETLLRGYKVIPQKNGFLIHGPCAHNFYTFEEVINRLYLSSEEQKKLLLRKIFLSKGGILRQRKYHERVGDMFVTQLKRHPSLTPLLRNILVSTMSVGDSVRIFPPLESVLVSMMLRPALKRGDNGEASLKIFDRLSKGVVSKVTKITPGGWTPESIKLVLDKPAVELTKEILERQPTTGEIYQAYKIFLTTLKDRLGIVESEEGEVKEPKLIDPIEVVIGACQSLGAVGVRFLQVMGQYIDLPDEYQEKFRRVYDSMPGQSKFTAFSILERVAKEDEATRKFLEEELVSIDRKIGGGSIMTTFKIKTRDGEGYKEEVLKVKNPNAERFVNETITQVRRIISDLKERDRAQRSNYEVAERLLDTIETWVIGDIKDERYIVLDPVFCRLHEDRRTSQDIVIKTSPARKPNNRYIQREEFIDGITVNKLQSQEEFKEKVGDIVEAIAIHFKDQLTQPAYYQRENQPVYLVHSDIHSGNFIFQTSTGYLYPIDRHFYLELNKDDVGFVRTVISDLPPKEKLRAIVDFFLTQPENTDLGLEGEGVTKGIFETLARKRIFDILGGQRKEDTSLQLMTKILHELDRRGVSVPLRVRILIKNIDAVNKMLELANRGSFRKYLEIQS